MGEKGVLVGKGNFRQKVDRILVLQFISHHREFFVLLAYYRDIFQLFVVSSDRSQLIIRIDK